MKIYNVFYSNHLQKALIDPLISQVNKPVLSVIINNKKSERLKIFLTLGIMKAKSNIMLNRLTGMRTRNGMMFLDLIIL